MNLLCYQKEFACRSKKEGVWTLIIGYSTGLSSKGHRLDSSVPESMVNQCLPYRDKNEGGVYDDELILEVAEELSDEEA